MKAKAKIIKSAKRRAVAAAAQLRRISKTRQCLANTEWLISNVSQLQCMITCLEDEINQIRLAYMRRHPDDFLEDDIPF